MKFLTNTPRLLRAALFALLFTASAGTHAYGQATTVTTSENIPFASTLTNPCNGDLVTFSGTLHVVNSDFRDLLRVIVPVRNRKTVELLRHDI